MTRTAAVLLLLAVPASAGTRSAAVYDPAGRAFLLAEGVDRQRPPASTAKLMTALLASERLKPDARVRVSARAAAMPRTKAGLRAGAVYRAGDLLEALLVGSSNDAAAALAEAVAGSESLFAGLMNRRARELGCTRTRFANASGLTAPGQVSTCRDLLRIYAAARARSDLARILGMPSKSMRHPGGAVTVMRNHNRMLGTVTGKTGYTRAARHCFVGSFRRDGRELLVACMGSGRLWDDLRGLMAGPGEGASDRDDTVLRAQQALRRRGFDPGPLDGVSGRRTREAVRAFQRSRFLPADGELRDATLLALGIS